MNKSFKIKFGNEFNTIENSEFVQGTAYIAYVGENRNGSNISEEAFEEADSSLGLIPVVGNFREDVGLFGGHDSTIEIVGGKLTLKDNTIPYGVVKENHNARWEEVTEEDGTVNKYRVCDVVLWAGRYETPVQSVIDGNVGQSMEINILDGEFGNKGVFDIKSMEYSALCLLGKDVDDNGEKTENHTEPCFESSTVVVSEDFSINFNDMLEKIYADKKIEVTKFSIADIDENVNQNTESDSETVEEFVLTHRDIRTQLHDKIRSYENGNYYWVAEVSDNYFVAETWGDDYYKLQYSVVDNEVVIDFDVEPVEMFRGGFVTKEDLDALNTARDSYEKRIKDLEVELETSQSNNKKLADEVSEYKNNKLNAEKDEVFNKFDVKLSDNEEYLKIKESRDSFSVDEITKNCLAIIGKMSLDTETVKTQFATSPVSSSTDSELVRKYGRWSK